MRQRRTVGQAGGTGLAEQPTAEMIAHGIDPQPLPGQPAHGRIRRQQPPEPAPVVAKGATRGQNHDVDVRRKPHLDVGKHGSHVAYDAGDDGKGQLVQLDPLAEHTVVGKAGPHDPEELRRIQRRDTRHPRIGRLRHDHIEPVAVQLEGTARVVHDGRDAGSPEDRVVDTREQRTHREHGGLDLDDPHPPHAGHLSDYAGRDAAAEPDHQGGRGLGSGRRGGEREHDLRVHVAVVGRVDLAVDAQRAAGCPLPHAHGRVPAFAKRELTRAAVCKEGLPRGGVHGVACVDRGSEIDQA